MLISLLFENPIVFAVIALGLVISVTIHEFAHAWTADKLGDPTPRVQDRITLNPMAHLDPLGTLAILFIGFGWGKPVEFDPYNLKNPVKDAALIALAGPASNIILASILAVLYHIFFAQVPDPTILLLLLPVLQVIISINVMLAIFNLVPIHPLDGSKILVALLPRQAGLEYEHFMERYGQFVLLALLFIRPNGVSLISQFISPVIDFILLLLGIPS